MFKIDKSLIDTMNTNRSCIMITHKDTVKEKAPEPIRLEQDAELPDAVKEKANEYLEKASAKARQILCEAEAEAEGIREAARKEGYAAGLEEGREVCQTKIKACQTELKDSLSKLETYRAELYETLESHVLALAMDVAEKILNIQMQRDDTLYKEIVKKAVTGIKHTDAFSVYVSQPEFEKYFKDGADWLRQETGTQDIDVVCDPALPQGSCIVEAESEVVDASVPTQLRKIGQYLGEQVG